MTRSAETTMLEPSDVLVVEGILVLCDENLRTQLDLAVYLEIDPATRLQRIIKRDGEERGRDEQTVRNRVEATVEPMHQLHVLPSKASADLVFQTSGDLTESIAVLCGRMGL
jgi:uridine kinase